MAPKPTQTNKKSRRRKQQQPPRKLVVISDNEVVDLTNAILKLIEGNSVISSLAQEHQAQIMYAVHELTQKLDIIAGYVTHSQVGGVEN